METFTETNFQDAVSNTDILIPLYVDHPDRMANLRIVIKYLKSIGFENIFVREYYDARSPEFELIGLLGPDKFTYYPIGANDNFNKMQCINELADMSNSKYLAIWDVDVVFPKSNIRSALSHLVRGGDVVYPYDGRFYNVLKSDFKSLERGEINLDNCELCNTHSYGGAVFFNRESFVGGGKCNPNFKNVGFDDNEIFVRFRRLEFDISRTSGPLLHLDHYRSETSVEHSKFIDHNMQIYNRVCNMPIEDLKKEIKTWK